ncbi:hypothetical protein SAMN04487769_2293 [Burkholderia sp. b14]|nr:hypothetical protein SAMN04487769_2293 [Burkholderia sp. b14]
MRTDSQKRRTPAEQRAANRRLLAILIGIVAVFFMSVVLKHRVA